MPNLIAYNSKKSAFISILIYIAATGVVGYFLWQSESTQVLVILGVLAVFLSLWIVIYLRQFFDKKPQLVMNDDGIFTPELGSVKWTNVKEIFVRSDEDRDFVCLGLDDYNQYQKNAPRGGGMFPSLNPVSGSQTIDIDLSGLEVETDTVERVILDLIRSDKLNVE